MSHCPAQILAQRVAELAAEYDAAQAAEGDAATAGDYLRPSLPIVEEAP